MLKLGATNLTCVDITDVLFQDLKQKYPNIKLIKKDISTEEINDRFDIIVIIGVIHHIVTDEKFLLTMQNINKYLVPGGFLIISPIKSKPVKSMFHVNFRSLNSFTKKLPSHKLCDLADFSDFYYSDNKILVTQKQHSP